MKFKKSVLIFLIISLFANFSLFAETSKSTTPEPYDTEEFPQGLKDLRRFEIITLGSMPFVMLDCNLIYSGILTAQGQQAYPLTPSNYSTEQQLGLILTSLGVSCSIGLTDFIVNKIKKGTVKKSNKKNKNKSVLITPIEEDPDAIKIQNKEDSDEILEDLQ